MLQVRAQPPRIALRGTDERSGWEPQITCEPTSQGGCQSSVAGYTLTVHCGQLSTDLALNCYLHEPLRALVTAPRPEVCRS